MVEQRFTELVVMKTGLFGASLTHIYACTNKYIIYFHKEMNYYLIMKSPPFIDRFTPVVYEIYIPLFLRGFFLPISE